MKVKPRFSIGLGGPRAGVDASTEVGGNSQASVSVGVNPLSGGVGVTPRLRIGDSPNAQLGSSIGGTAGAAVGSTFGPAGAMVGSAMGSAAGSIAASKPRIALAAADPITGGALALADKIGISNRGDKGSDKRAALFSAFRDAGLIGADYESTQPDGTTFKLDDNTTHSWKNPGQRVDNLGERDLYGYEIDYTNDMDYVSGMAGITLSRMLSGGTGKNIDQAGNSLGNAFLGSVGFGNELTQKNFNTVMSNARAQYAKVGVKSKEDALTLANQMYAESRLNDFDYGVAQQTASLVFDQDFGLAQQLMGGRWNGVKTAGKTPDASERKEPDTTTVHSPKISAQEAMASVRPYFDEYRRRNPLPGRQQGASNIASGVGLISSLAGAYTVANRASGGVIGEAVTDTARDFAEYIGLIEAPTSDVGVVDGVGGIDGAITEGEYDLGSDYSLDF